MTHHVRLPIACLLRSVSVGFGQHTVPSGSPLPFNPDSPDSYFALPSVNGFLKGTAHVNDDAFPDLFLYSDRYNPGTFYYLFERFSPEGVPVYSEKKQIRQSFGPEWFSVQPPTTLFSLRWLIRLNPPLPRAKPRQPARI